MRVVNGMILASVKDEATGLDVFVPYFPYVRSKDILFTDPVEIGSKLKQMSTRWRMEESLDHIEYTSYTLKCSYDNLLNDSTGESIGSSYLDATVTYKLYKDGNIEIEGFVHLNGTATDYGADRTKIEKVLYLPYATIGTPNVICEYGFGSVNGLTITAGISGSQNRNSDLNPLFTDREYYQNRLTIETICPKSDSSTNELSTCYKKLDTLNSLASYSDYTEKLMPIHFKLIGTKWK